MTSSKISEFYIELENLKAVYHSGDIIDGKVFLKLSERLKISEIKCLFHGQANVQWLLFNFYFLYLKYSKSIL